MANVKTADLIAKFQYALDNKWGYILGTAGETWTQAKQNAATNEMTQQYGYKWIGRRVADCSGLFYWAFKQLGGYMYHGSNSMWNRYCTSQGKLSGGKRTDGKELKPGTAVFVLKNGSDRSHVGLYIGGDTVIEASGTQTGVTTSKITNKKWAEWGELKGVDYTTSNSASGGGGMTTNVGSAVVNDTKVAIRSAPSTSAAVLTRVDKGQRVQVIKDDTWTKVSYLGKTGYMMTKFLDQ